MNNTGSVAKACFGQESPLRTGKLVPNAPDAAIPDVTGPNAKLRYILPPGTITLANTHGKQINEGRLCKATPEETTTKKFIRAEDSKVQERTSCTERTLNTTHIKHILQRPRSIQQPVALVASLSTTPKYQQHKRTKFFSHRPISTKFIHTFLLTTHDT